MGYARITNQLMNTRSTQNLHTNLSRLNELQNKLSSGQNINAPSDDPIGLSRLLGIQETQNKDERYLKNINAAVSELSSVDSVLNNTSEIIQRARELSIQASNMTNGPDELSAIMEEVQQLLNQAVQIGNTKFGDKYIFGGLRTTMPPFTQAAGEITYDGSLSPNHERETEIGNGVKITINFPGDQIFGQHDTVTPNEYGLLNSLSTLIENLNTTITTPTSANYDLIRQSIDDLDNDLSTVLSVQTTVGSLVNRLDMTENRLEERKISLAKEYGSIQDVDLSSVISDLNFQESVFQTSLAATARTLQPTILNYM